MVASNPICVIGCVEQAGRLGTQLHRKHIGNRRGRWGFYVERLIQFKGVTAVGKFTVLLSSFFMFVLIFLFSNCSKVQIYESY
jgi:hypothetical protein